LIVVILSQIAARHDKKDVCWLRVIERYLVGARSAGQGKSRRLDDRREMRAVAAECAVMDWERTNDVRSVIGPFIPS
jgi:hypothetical protein